MTMVGVIEKLLLLAVVLFAVQIVNGKLKSVSPEEESLIENKLKLLNKPAVKSIQSEDGDIIDCVDIYKQPAFDHPLLKNHTIQLRPSEEQFGKGDGASSDQATGTFPGQVWQKSGSCPNGTIPILRVQRHHLLNAPSIENYGRKPWTSVDKHEIRLNNGETLAIGAEALHEHGVLVASGYNYIAARGVINVWNPWVEGDDEYTSGQIWLKNGPYDSSESIEVGWIVNPSLFNDRTARFFIYWTTDSGKTTGCFNLLCSGFVQTSSDITLGATISGVSSWGGTQYEFTINVWKDYLNDRWWLVFGDEVAVGYWPDSLFNGLSKTATLAIFGGDVYSPRIKQKPHTATRMGSGGYSSQHLTYAAYIRLPRIKDYSQEYKYPDPFGTTSTRPDCYSAENYADALWTEPHFYFGGPGRNEPYCP